MDKLTLATRIWAREDGQKYVYWNHLLSLFDRFLIHEQTALGGLIFASNGKPKYLDYSYRDAVGQVLVQCEHAPKEWQYLEYDDEKKITARQTKDLFPIVFNLVYGYKEQVGDSLLAM